LRLLAVLDHVSLPVFLVPAIRRHAALRPGKTIGRSAMPVQCGVALYS
jgi:hypothetical protein